MINALPINDVSDLVYSFKVLYHGREECNSTIKAIDDLKIQISTLESNQEADKYIGEVTLLKNQLVTAEKNLKSSLHTLKKRQKEVRINLETKLEEVNERIDGVYQQIKNLKNYIDGCLVEAQRTYNNGKNYTNYMNDMLDVLPELKSEVALRDQLKRERDSYSKDISSLKETKRVRILHESEIKKYKEKFQPFRIVDQRIKGHRLILKILNLSNTPCKYIAVTTKDSTSLNHNVYIYAIPGKTLQDYNHVVFKVRRSFIDQLSSPAIEFFATGPESEEKLEAKICLKDQPK